MLKRLVRGAIKRTKQWLEEKPSEKISMIDEKPRYQWLNGQCLKVLEHDKRRPNYVWGVIQGAGLAQALGVGRISVVEFGVAGGNGLIALQDIAVRVEEMFGVKIDVYGFDAGTGLPKPIDYRDLPNLFSEGFYPMDVEKLGSRLNKAHLCLGQIENTVADFIRSRPAPVAFISFDLDLYSSTKHAFALFEADQNLILPRIYCYFDDILGFTYSEFTGELLAIREFNAVHKTRKVSKINGLKYYVPSSLADHRWVDQFYLAHIFDHESYGRYDGLNPTTALNL